MLTPEQLQFIDRWFPYAMQVANGMRRDVFPFVARDDIRAWAAMGLIRAARTFDPAKAAPNIHVSVCCQSTIRDYQRNEYQTRRKITEVHSPPPDRPYSDHYVDRCEDVLNAAQIISTVRKRLKVGSQAWRVFQLLYAGLPNNEICRYLGVDESRISQIKTKVLRPLFQQAMAS